VFYFIIFFVFSVHFRFFKNLKTRSQLELEGIVVNQHNFWLPSSVGSCPHDAGEI